MSIVIEPTWSVRSNDPVPVPVIALGSDDELSCSDNVIRYPGLLVEADAACATGSSALLAPQPPTPSAPAAIDAATASADPDLRRLPCRAAPVLALI
jgi:hypothetical protein